jgi:hypothetical protein
MVYRMSGLQERIAEMKRFALFMLVLAFCTHCTNGRTPSTIEDEGQTKTSATASQQQARTRTTQRAPSLVQDDSDFLAEPLPRVVVTQRNDYNVTLELQAWLDNERVHVKKTT